MTAYLQLHPHLKRLYRTAIKNAARRGVAFELSKEDFAAICDRANGQCEFSKINFDYATKTSDAKWSRRPWAASLDRIKHTEGYNARNCRLICVAVNIALNTWGSDVLLTVARAILGLAQPRRRSRRSGKLLGIDRTAAGTFSARARVNGVPKRLGTFPTEAEALAAYYRAKGLRNLAPALPLET